jgi:hypothetical protein
LSQKPTSPGVTRALEWRLYARHTKGCQPQLIQFLQGLSGNGLPI